MATARVHFDAPRSWRYRLAWASTWKGRVMISKRFKTTLLPLCVALVSVCGAPGATAQAFGSQTETKEPTTAPALLTLPQMPLHDPWIVADRATRVYYLYTSNVASITGVPGIGTMLYTSRNLHDWTRPKVVFRIPRGIWANAGGWAPEVHAYRGRYWLFTTLHNETAKLPPSRSGRTTYRRGTVLAVSDRLEGPFRLVRSGAPVAPPSGWAIVWSHSRSTTPPRKGLGLVAFSSRGESGESSLAHSMQASGSARTIALSPLSKPACGQTSMHVPQRLHLSASYTRVFLTFAKSSHSF